MRSTTVASLSAVVLLAVGCHPGGNGDEDLTAARESLEASLAPREVRLVLPEERVENPTIEVVGEVRAFDTVPVPAEVAGTIDRMLVEVGDRVRSGEPLVRIDAETYQLHVERAEAELEAARAELELADKELERKRDLVSDQTIPQAAYDQAVAAHRLATARVASAEASMRLARRDQERSVVRAPADGIVSERLVAAGQWVDVGFTLVEVALEDRVKVAARVPAEWAPRLAGIEEFEFTVAGSDPITAEVYSVDPVVRGASRSFEIVGTAPASSETLRPGMFASVTLRSPAAVRSLWLPASAVETADIPQVMRAIDGEVVPVDVQAGRTEDGLVEIVSGLEPDEPVIADVSGLARGLPVEVVEQPVGTAS